MKSFSIILVLFVLLSINFHVNANANCGVRPNSNRIVGGAKSTPGDWGWTVALHKSDGFFCGATLISNNALLTAAHCFLSSDYKTKLPNGFKALIGVHNRANMESWVQTRTQAKLFVHEQYDWQPLIDKNDIALIKFKAPVQFNNYKIFPACMENQNQNFRLEGEEVWITGWGSTFFGPSLYATPAVTEKRQVPIKIWRNSECGKFPDYILNTMICGGDLSKTQTGAGACKGDSGGPLSYKKDNKWYLVGIVSGLNGGKCGNNTIFTRVSAYKNWIARNMAIVF